MNRERISPEPDDGDDLVETTQGPEAAARGCRQPLPDTLARDDDALLLELAEQVQGRRLTAVAILWLESFRPVTFLGSQVMHFANPFVNMLFDTEKFERLAEIFEERSHLDRLLCHLEALADSEQAQEGEAES